MLNNHVLVIEDDKAIAEYFQAVLAMAGMEVEVVLTAREGLIRLAGNVPGLILLDMYLGKEIGGEDILYQIRSNPRLDGTRVIIITGYPNIAQSVADLADLILLKPVGIDQLTTLAKRMISLEFTHKAASFRDPVTTLFNLDFFYTRLDLAFERARRRPEFLYAVIQMQIDMQGLDGQTIRPNLDMAKAALAELGRRMKQNLRPTDTLARVEGWKFVTLHEDLRCNEDTQIIIERIEQVLAQPFIFGDQSYLFQMKYGVATRGPAFRNAEEIFKAAGESLNQAA